ncbi:hypothetical protein HDV02_004709 [Globomyces sp. JEL0801]|nr:hypothetical protein HDV02_004709 [Globomyces sp. JEL0801]
MNIQDIIVRYPEQLSQLNRHRIALDISDLMEYVHQNNYIYPSISLTMIFSNSSRHDYITQILADGISQNGEWTGQPSLYDAPELTQRNKKYTKETDVFRFGIILFYLVFSCYPEKLPLPEDSLDTCPHYLKELLKDCLAIDPNHRPQFSSIKTILSQNYCGHAINPQQWPSTYHGAFLSLMSNTTTRLVFPRPIPQARERKKSTDSGYESDIDSKNHYTIGHLIFSMICTDPHTNTIPVNDFILLLCERFELNYNLLDLNCLAYILCGSRDDVNAQTLDECTFKYHDGILYPCLETQIINSFKHFLKQFEMETVVDYVMAGKRYYLGLDIPQYHELALYCFQHAVSLITSIEGPGAQEALVCLGIYHLSNSYSNTCYSKAFEFLYEVYKHNNNALFTLIHCFSSGIGTPKNDDAALVLLKKSISKGLDYATHLMGQLYANEVDVDDSKPLVYFRKPSICGIGRNSMNYFTVYFDQVSFTG